MQQTQFLTSESSQGDRHSEGSARQDGISTILKVPAVHHGSPAEATMNSPGRLHTRGLRLNTKSSSRSHPT